MNKWLFQLGDDHFILKTNFERNFVIRKKWWNMFVNFWRFLVKNLNVGRTWEKFYGKVISVGRTWKENLWWKCTFGEREEIFYGENVRLENVRKIFYGENVRLENVRKIFYVENVRLENVRKCFMVKIYVTENFKRNSINVWRTLDWIFEFINFTAGNFNTMH